MWWSRARNRRVAVASNYKLLTVMVRSFFFLPNSSQDARGQALESLLLEFLHVFPARGGGNESVATCAVDEYVVILDGRCLSQ
jgi:hypothetical protein